MDAQPAAQDSEVVAIIVTGGDPVGPEADLRLPPEPSLVIAADSGLDHARRAGLRPTVLIGDLDSVSADAQRAFRQSEGEVIEHPVDKDDTDLALAMRYAMDQGATTIAVLGGAGQRMSHILGNCAAIAHAARQRIHTTWHSDSTVIHVATPDTTITVSGTPGDLVSLLPHGGPAEGVSTSGLRWGLDCETLHADATRGVSNELTDDAARVDIESGLLFVVHERKTAS